MEQIWNDDRGKQTIWGCFVHLSFYKTYQNICWLFFLVFDMWSDIFLCFRWFENTHGLGVRADHGGCPFFFESPRFGKWHFQMDNLTICLRNVSWLVRSLSKSIWAHKGARCASGRNKFNSDLVKTPTWSSTNLEKGKHNSRMILLHSSASTGHGTIGHDLQERTVLASGTRNT